MDERLRQRLIGALILLGLAFLLVSLLPRKDVEQPAGTEPDVVTIDLRGDEPVAIEVVQIGQTETPESVRPVSAVEAGDSVPELPGDPPGDVDAASSVPTATPTPRATPTPTPTLTPTPKPTVTPAPPPRATPVPTSRAVVAASGGDTRWWVQVGSFSDIGNAHGVEDRLKAVGQPAIISPVAAAQGTLYRVRGGPYASQAAADAALGKIRAAGFADARVVAP